MSQYYDPDRQDRVLKLQELYAMPLYCAYWGVRREHIDEHDGNDSDMSRRQDFSGHDKCISPGDGRYYTMAQRFRGEKDNYSIDFSLRYESPGGRTEYDKVETANEDPYGDPPRFYAHGVTADDGEEGLDDGFRHFRLIDFHRFCELHFDGVIEPIWPPGHKNNQNGDGTSALYFEFSDLRDSGCIIEHWEHREIQSIVEGEWERGYSPTKQLGFDDFDGDTQ